MRRLHESYISIGDIALDLNVALKTVQKWFDSGKLKGIRFPTTGNKAAVRRVLRRDYEAFREEYGMVRMDDPNLVLAVGCTVYHPGDLEIINVCSSFDAGISVSDRHPSIVVVDWSIGIEQAASIAARCNSLPSYRPLLVALGSSQSDAIDSGYACVVEPPLSGDKLKSILRESGRLVVTMGTI